jgi:hypothetical protein
MDTNEHEFKVTLQKKTKSENFVSFVAFCLENLVRLC